jgi:hypothetical protein
MKTVLLYQPPLMDNPNDSLIIEGVIDLLEPYNVFVKHVRYGEKLPDGDVFIVCGTPWIYDRCSGSYKLNELKRVVKHFNGMKAALGIGSSFPAGYDILSGDGVTVDVWSLFNTISVRDDDAKQLLGRSGIVSERLACPALFSPFPDIRPTKRAVCVSCTNGDASTPAMALSQNEADALYRAGHNVCLVTKVVSLKYELAKYEKVITSRVHTAILLHGRREIVPVQTDTRMNAYLELGDRSNEELKLRTWFDETLGPHLG